MKSFDIFIMYISWGKDGKRRPVLVYAQDSVKVAVYLITTKYDGKSEAIKANYFKITDWVHAGLNKVSYVDTGTLVKLPKSSIAGKAPIGRLSASDIKNFLNFLHKISIYP